MAGTLKSTDLIATLFTRGKFISASILAIFALFTSSGYADNFSTFSLPGYHLQPRIINASGTVAGLARGNSEVQIFIRNTKGDIELFLPENSITLPLPYLGMNDKGDLTGTYLDGVSGTYKGFVRSSNGSVSTYSAPDSQLITIQTDINNSGAVIGAYATAQGEVYGFVRKGNHLESFQAPTGNPDARNVQTIPLFINIKGVVSGMVYYDAPESTPGSTYVNYVSRYATFIRDVDGNITLVDLAEQYIPNDYLIADLQIVPTGMNASGSVSGYFQYALYNSIGNRVADIQKGFLTDSNGAMLEIDPPGASYLNNENLLESQAQASGINDAGKVAGYYRDPTLNANAGFVFSDKGAGRFETFPLSNYGPSAITGINNAGKIIGYYYNPDSASFHGFIK